MKRSSGTILPLFVTITSVEHIDSIPIEVGQSCLHPASKAHAHFHHGNKN